jgi:SAM-dependent methyltransferase
MRQAPAAERNKAAILDVLEQVLPDRGLVLEIASGTGQHVVHFASALPGLTWQPSDPDPAMRASIADYIAASGMPNVVEPLALDARDARWPIARADAIVCSNMIHIAPWSAAEGLVRGAGRLLGRGMPLVLYGPFQRAGRHTAPSNAAFDESLRQRDAEWGVRDLDEVEALARAQGFALDRVIAMPANNLSAVFVRAADPGACSD